MLNNLMAGLSSLLCLENFLFINIGLALGIVFGAMPGLSGAMGVALFLPVTFGMQPTAAMMLLCGIYCGAVYGGSITAILIKTPGTSAAAATVLDGYALTQKGHAGKALSMALVASTFGGMFSAFMLLFISPIIAKFALEFGPAEYFSLALFGLSVIISLSSKNIYKGIISGCVGMFFAMVGLDPIEYLPRLTFGNVYLMGGISVIPSLIGLFAVTEMLKKISTGETQINTRVDFIREKLSWNEIKECIPTMLKCSVMGTILGAIPGTGATTAAFLGYNEARRSAKNPEEFGSGSLCGISAAESANNATTGSTLIPTLTLGIPGDEITAIMLGALTMQGLTPGPNLFETQGPIVYSIILGFFVVNIFMYIQGTLFIKGFVNITRIPTNFLLSVLSILCIVGGFALNNSSFEIYLVIFFGVLGYLMMKMGFPVVPLLLAIVLGPIAENGMRQALIISRGSPMIFLQKPISCVVIILSIAFVVIPLVRNARDAREAKKTAAENAQ